MADLAEQATLELKSKGNEYFKAKQYSEAIEQYTQAILLNPKFYDCFSNRAACYINLKQYDKALEDVDKCISIDRNGAKGYWRKGDALQGLQRYDDAINAYTQGSKYATGADKVQLQAAIERCTRLKSPPTPRTPRAAPTSSFLNSAVPLHITVLATAIVGVLPTDISYEAFYWCLKFSILLNLLLLIQAVLEQQHYPHFQPEGPGWLAKAKVIGMIIVMSNEFHYCTTAALFLTSRPFFFCNLPQAIRSVKAISIFFQNTAPAALARVATKVLSHDLDGFCASVEILTGFLLVLELVLPSRNFLVCIMYWQFLRARYMTEMQKPYSPKTLVKAFAATRQQLDGVFLHARAPGLLQRLYNKAQAFFGNMVDPVQASQQKCSIM